MGKYIRKSQRIINGEVFKIKKGACCYQIKQRDPAAFYTLHKVFPKAPITGYPVYVGQIRVFLSDRFTILRQVEDFNLTQSVKMSDVIIYKP